MSTEADNPYAPPQAEIAAPEAPIDLTQFDDAGNGKRFLNWILDRVATQSLIYLLVFILGLFEGAFIVRWYNDFLDDTGVFGANLIGYLITAFYYIAMEGVFGFTLGKLVTGTRVVDEAGNKASWGAIIGRSFARFVPFEPFSFFGGGSGGWHDQWSGTRVVDIRNRVPRLAPGLLNAYKRRY